MSTATSRNHNCARGANYGFITAGWPLQCWSRRPSDPSDIAILALLAYPRPLTSLRLTLRLA